jgi:hydroxylamine reductase (hybrid-cluster protein)
MQTVRFHETAKMEDKMLQTNVFISMNGDHSDADGLIDASTVCAVSMHIVRGIALYAYGMRRYSATDDQVDRFVVELLAASVSEKKVRSNEVKEMIERAEKIRDRARTLYGWAAEANGRTPRTIDEQFECLSDDIGELAFKLEQEKQSHYPDDEVQLQFDLCRKRLGAFATLLLSSQNPSAIGFDAYEFIHRALGTLAYCNTLVELKSLSRYIETKMLMLVHSLMSGGTLVDVPKTELRSSSV